MPISLPFSTLEAYENFVYTLANRYPSIEYSTLVFVRLDPLAGELTGELHFAGNIVLRVFEIVDFRSQRILKYGYEVYRGTEQLYWYDDFPHPHIPALAGTLPHHKHVPPDVKHNRVPAPELSFEQANLPFLIEEIGQSLLAD